jgi:fatty-acyl-CoA synthase
MPAGDDEGVPGRLWRRSDAWLGNDRNVADRHHLLGYADLTGEARLDAQSKQGHAPFGVELKITDDAGRRLAWDGTTSGRLKVRGPAVAKAYFNGEGGQLLDAEGYFDTGDVSTIDAHGYMQITDRSKDIIKSGGEWISSIDLENLAVSNPAVAEAAVIGIQSPMG